MTSDPADSLYETPPAEFVKARNALVKSLKAQGDRAEAERISKLARPTASVWASNRIARHAADLVARLADVTGRLQGGIQRDRDRYAAAINEHRDLLNQLRGRAEQVLGEGGLRVSPAVIAAAVQNFRTGLADEAVRPLLVRGRLERDVGLEAGDGLFGMTAVDVDTARAPRSRPSPPRPAHAGHAEARALEREQHERARALAKARAEAERRVHALGRSAEAAAAVRAKRESEANEARRRLESAEQALVAAQAAEREANAALATAQSDLQKLAGKPA